MGTVLQDVGRVLVVDANAHIRRLIATLLGAVGVVDVIEARSPEAALAALAALAGRTPDLVVLDWTAEPTEALLFVHRIRRGELLDAHTPVMAMAGSTHHAVLERAWEAGIDEVIAKPLSAIEVIQRSAALIGAFRQRDADASASAAE
jgi:CheY-like chemotaxis protein